jgi:hypothetical protein
LLSQRGKQLVARNASFLGTGEVGVEAVAGVVAGVPSEAVLSGRALRLLLVHVPNLDLDMKEWSYYNEMEQQDDC